MINFLKKNTTQIFLASFLILFLELSLIRWLGSYVMCLAYFSNLVLLASFFGAGVGCLSTNRKNIFKFLPYFLLAVVALIYIPLSIVTNFKDMVSFQNLRSDYLQLPLWAIIIPLFLAVSIIFVGPGQKLGTLLSKSESLTSYIWNLVGSIAGVVAFSSFSFLQVGPLSWFTLLITLYFMLMFASNEESKYIQNKLIKIILISIATLFLVASQSQKSWWSPYYRITLDPIKDSNHEITGFDLHVNQTGHQTLQKPEDKEWIYSTPYEIFNNPLYKNILIIGAGAGTDSSIALTKNVEHIDAVEIDPTIAELGKAFHPSKPYADPRVKITIADGRNFLEHADKKYDLIIFALTDSLTLASSYANTRLESYLFTTESMQQAKNHLSDNGLLVLYNYYREPWLINKLSSMVGEVFGEQPFVMQDSGQLASIFSGPKLHDLKKSIKKEIPASFEAPEFFGKDLARDDWPFIYLKTPSIPKAYLLIIAMLSSIMLVILLPILSKKGEARKIPWSLFFLGAGFMLLETKNIINFQLLFGSTWVVNALVFLSILTMALLACLITRSGFKIKKSSLYILMILSLILEVLIPLKSMSGLPLTSKYIFASLLTLSPVFFANLIFAKFFDKINNADKALGINLIGAMLGGLGEYAAMLIGYNALSFLIIAIYIAAFIAAELQMKKS